MLRRPRVSRRSAYLLGFGGVWITLGSAYVSAPQAASISLYHGVPMLWQGLAWVVCGAVAVLSILPHAPRPLGFAAALVPPLLWSLGFALEILNGRAYALQGVILWGLLAYLVVLSAGDNDRPLR